VADSVGYVWSFPHAQLYTEPARLAAAGLLKEQREKGGRNRRHFTITAMGHGALLRWLSQPSSERAEPRELRDPGLLRLFFADLLSGPEISALARDQAAAHRKRLAALETDASRFGALADHSVSFGPLRMGLIYERAAIAFWNEIARQATKHRKRTEAAET
jgi:PadR family transcriptional regulator AphA